MADNWLCCKSEEKLRDDSFCMEALGEGLGKIEGHCPYLTCSVGGQEELGLGMAASQAASDVT